MKTHDIDVGDVIRLPNYVTAGGWRVWRVVANCLGATRQEDFFQIETIDQEEAGEVLRVPCVILDTHPDLQICTKAKSVLPDIVSIETFGSPERAEEHAATIRPTIKGDEARLEGIEEALSRAAERDEQLDEQLDDLRRRTVDVAERLRQSLAGESDRINQEAESIIGDIDRLKAKREEVAAESEAVLDELTFCNGETGQKICFRIPKGFRAQATSDGVSWEVELHGKTEEPEASEPTPEACKPVKFVVYRKLEPQDVDWAIWLLGWEMRELETTEDGLNQGMIAVVPPGKSPENIGDVWRNVSRGGRIYTIPALTYLRALREAQDTAKQPTGQKA